MVSQPLREAVRDHYDRLSPFYRRFWGEHIHHGFWEQGDEPFPVREAQERLIERLATFARVPRGARVLDVGCGLGGSSLWLARHRNCSVLGITLSPVQAALATEQARKERLDGQVHFERRDATCLDLPLESFDAIWVIECSEHLEDKARFFAECARVLRPGGALALCAWLAADDPAPEQQNLIHEVCRGMLCPSLGSQRDYLRWLRAAGFAEIAFEDITRRVEQTWEHCALVARRPEVQLLLRTADDRTRDFVGAFDAIHQAYAEGAMAYGMFAATRTRGGAPER